MLVEAIVLAIVGVTANQPVPVPDLDSLRIDAKHLSHLLDRQHSSLAEAIIAWCHSITPLNAGHNARGERLTFPGL
jgi:hypothetical protein